LVVSKVAHTVQAHFTQVLIVSLTGRFTADFGKLFLAKSINDFNLSDVIHNHLEIVPNNLGDAIHNVKITGIILAHQANAAAAHQAHI